MSQELDKTEAEGVVIPAQAQRPLFGMSFAEMMAGADVVEGGDLLSGEDAKADLIGIPFLIYRATFRDGIKEKGTGIVRNYVSFDVITADEQTYKARAKFMPKDVQFGPGTSLVFNDGSTGLCRQITEYLHEKGLINVGDVDKTGGAMGESAYDRPRIQWTYPRAEWEVMDGGDYPDIPVDCRLFLPRGLRVSEYSNDYTEDGKTYYFG